MAAVLLGAITTPACGPAFPDAPSGTSSTSNALPAVSPADLAYCVADINRYRAQANRPSLAESAVLEGFAADGARADAATGVPHSHFTSSNGGGIATAENELLAFDRQLAPTVQDAMHSANAIFWAEGPTGPHYQTLTGPYSQVGCGVFLSGAAVTVVQDFR